METNLNLAEVKEAIGACGDNPKLAKYKASLEALLPNLEAEEAKVKKEAAFADKVAKGKVPPVAEWPEGVYNIYLAKGTIEDTTKPLEEVEVDGVKVKRFPKVMGIVTEVNKAVVVVGGRGTSGEGKGKGARAITVTLEGKLIGNFPGGEAACKALGYTTGGDSANRVLREARGTNPYYFSVKPYNGANFTSAEIAKANLKA